MKTKVLKKNYEFRKVFEKKNYYAGKYLEIFILKNGQNENFLGLAISKKIANSVQRNRIKRFIREAYREIENQVKQGYNIVILWKKNVPIEKANYANIVSDLQNVICRANLNKEVWLWNI